MNKVSSCCQAEIVKQEEYPLCAICGKEAKRILFQDDETGETVGGVGK